MPTTTSPGKERDAVQKSIKEDTTKVFAYQCTHTHGFAWVYQRLGK